MIYSADNFHLPSINRISENDGEEVGVDDGEDDTDGSSDHNSGLMMKNLSSGILEDT